LIVDEVLTGFGRREKCLRATWQHFATLCVFQRNHRRLLTMGVTLCTDRVESAFRSENRLHSFYHGHSYTGNALACAAANANLQIFDDERFSTGFAVLLPSMPSGLGNSASSTKSATRDSWRLGSA